MKWNLYRLIGSFVTGRVTMTTPSDLDMDSTTLWHMRLDHMSEKGMLILLELGLLKGVKTCKVNFCEFCLYGK